MKLASKLLLPAVVTAAVALAGGLLDSAKLRHEDAAQARTYRDDMASLRSITGAQARLGQLHAGVYRTIVLIASLDDQTVKAFRADARAQTDEVRKAIDAVSRQHGDDRELVDGAAKVGTLLSAYAGQADQAIDLASADPNTGVAAMQGADAGFKTVTASVDQLIQRIQADAAAAGEATARRSRDTSAAVWAAVLALSALALALSARATRRMVGSLREAAAMAEAVAGGDLCVEMSTDRGDEIGDLQRSLSQMVQRLRGSLDEVRLAAANMATASTEIATGNQDLSQRTEQTAGRLQQTASSMEQLTGAVGQSADAATQAKQLAGTATAVATRGGEAMAQVVSTMDEIHNASRKIGDIIGVIDGIAFQTNILALNAAVEAARAGEQGRGFAVVAGEVRSLAQRSADAAREIKGLIAASVDKVEGGSRQVQAAGQTMNDIVASSRRVSDIIVEITASTVEQRDGIGQINGAVTELDQMTQQNAALVEQSAAAADSLQQQARRLADIVAAFRLGQAAAPAPAAAPRRGPATPTTARVAVPRRPPVARAAPAVPSTPAPMTAAATPAGSDWESF